MIGKKFLSFHRDQSGTISIISVFALLLLTMLLGMVMNVGRQVDRKVRMQSAADACAYSGGLVLARGMNSLAFTNHLLCDVFALTAYMREARDRDAESLTPNILMAWQTIARSFNNSSYPKFSPLGGAIPVKVQQEQQMIQAFGNWSAASSLLILPVLETILQQELIPRYQRAVVQSLPQLALMTTQEIARQHGLLEGGRGDLQAMLWKTTGQPVGLGDEMAWLTRTLPAVDPIADMPFGPIDYFGIATRQRHDLSHRYLNDWNNQLLAGFDQEAKMSQFSNLWRGFTCGKLDQLLNVEYPNRNLLFVIRVPRQYITNLPQHLDQQFNWLAVVYRPHMRQTLPGLFRNPIASNDQAFAQVSLFVPRPRLVQWQPGLPPPGGLYGGVPGDAGSGGAMDDDGEGGPTSSRQIWTVTFEPRPTHWDLLNQNWTVQLTPATTAGLPMILSMPPGFQNVRVPNLSDFTGWDLQRINTH